MAATKPVAFSDWKQPDQGDSEGSVQDFQKRKMAYDKYVRNFKPQPAANANAPARSAIPTAQAGPAAAPQAPGAAPAPAAAPAAGGTAAAPVAGGFNLNVPYAQKNQSKGVNESKGEFASMTFEAKFNKLANEVTRIYNEQMPKLRNYDAMVQTQIDQLIGETMPQVQEIFRQSGEQYGFAKDFYEQTKAFNEESKNYDTAGRREQERGKAMTDVRMAGEASRNQAIETLESFGVDPSQARGAALDQNLRLQTALAQAQAGTEAELGVEKRGREYQAQGLTALGQGTGAVGEAASRTASNTAAGAGILEGNVKAQIAAKQGAIQTGEAGSQLLGQAGQFIQSSAGARQAQAASKAARQAAKGPSGLSQLATAGGSLAGMALGTYLAGPAGGAAGAQAGGALSGYATGGPPSERG